MAVIRTFFNSDTGEIMEEQESQGFTTTQMMHTRRFHFKRHKINSRNTTQYRQGGTTNFSSTVSVLNQQNNGRFNAILNNLRSYT